MDRRALRLRSLDGFPQGPRLPRPKGDPACEGPRRHLIGGKPLDQPNRKEPRFGHRAPHLDSSDWRAAVPLMRPHWVQRVRGKARLVGSCFPSPARKQ